MKQEPPDWDFYCEGAPGFIVDWPRSGGGALEEGLWPGGGGGLAHWGRPDREHQGHLQQQHKCGFPVPEPVFSRPPTPMESPMDLRTVYTPRPPSPTRQEQQQQQQWAALSSSPVPSPFDNPNNKVLEPEVTVFSRTQQQQQLATSVRKAATTVVGSAG